MTLTTEAITLSEAFQGLQGEPFSEYLTTNAFWIFLFLLFFNLVWTLWQLADRAFYKSCDCPTHNNAPASENALEVTRRDFMSRKITSRGIQCLAVTLSSFLLLAQLVEGYWISQLFTSVSTNRFTEWTGVTSHFEPPVLRYIFNLPAILFLFTMWTGIFGIGAVILDVQWTYTKELLKLNIKDLNKGYCRFAAETRYEKNGSEVDLEFGLVLADIEVPGNLFGTTYR
ncbi:hypothetical protein CDV31_005038 [Fusarium ambrosium]|uniref:Uncharacterized protein n=1 Tax=Fusarium ambrosium TaxID=131363 RepID=A0A428UMD3_9HYPO|nr:hypothetical protein CDV31_005038 [Fusarium ambrosium]